MTSPHPVFLVHGIWDTGLSMSQVKKTLLRSGWDRVHAIDFQPNDGGAPLKELAEQLDAFVSAHAPEGHFDVVGFSMGGLVTRVWLSLIASHQRCHTFISISAPHHGTLWGRFARRKAGVRDMHPRSPLMIELRQSTPKASNIYSYRTPFDLLIVPSTSSVLPNAIDRVFRVPIHRQMIRHSLVLNSIVDDLRAGSDIAF